MKSYKVSKYFRSLTIYHAKDTGRIVMTSRVVPHKGMKQTDRKKVVIERVLAEGMIWED